MSGICSVCGKPLHRGKLYCSHECRAAASKHYAKCLVCGKAFRRAPSNESVTCSPECSRAKRQMDLKPQMLPDNFLAIKEEYYSSLTSEEHPTSKIWILRDPHGKVHEVKNLINFFREHADEIDGTPEAAARGIKQIKATVLGKRKSGRCHSWKGWTLEGWDDCGIAERGSGGKKASRKYGNTVKRSFYSRVLEEGNVTTRKYHYTLSGGKLVRELLSNPGAWEEVHIAD